MKLQDLRVESKLLAVATILGLLLVQFGVKLDLVWYNETIELIVTLLTLVGVVYASNNNPTTKGIDKLTKKKK